MKAFEKKYRSVMKRREQNKMSRELSSEMVVAKQNIIKRYETNSPDIIDTMSPKKI